MRRRRAGRHRRRDHAARYAHWAHAGDAARQDGGDAATEARQSASLSCHGPASWLHSVHGQDGADRRRRDAPGRALGCRTRHYAWRSDFRTGAARMNAPPARAFDQTQRLLCASVAGRCCHIGIGQASARRRRSRRRGSPRLTMRGRPRHFGGDTHGTSSAMSGGQRRNAPCPR